MIPPLRRHSSAVSVRAAYAFGDWPPASAVPSVDRVLSEPFEVGVAVHEHIESLAAGEHWCKRSDGSHDEPCARRLGGDR